MQLENLNLYKKAKATFLYQTEEKSNFPHSKAVLLISVGQANHEGARLEATIKLINDNFQSCDVAVCDTLQRHTIQMSELSSPEEAYTKSMIEGKQWVKRNKKHLMLLNVPNEIFFWDKYLKSKDFLHCKDKIVHAYQNDEIFKSSMHVTIEEFVRRYERRSTGVNREKLEEYCFNYLTEECAIMMLMWPKCEYNYIIYPGNMPKVLATARDKFVFPYNPNLLKWTQVYIRSKIVSPTLC
ncbi:MAG: hypothetical protein BGO77_02325 [Caedibacter sp. 37-49]|nr:MAG: hypothetical protein BGO77_02325 [Caedibacter sp. 37-49]